MLRNTAIATLFFSGLVVAMTRPAHALELARYEFGSGTSGSPKSTDADPNSEANDFSSAGVATQSGLYTTLIGTPAPAIVRNDWAIGAAINLAKFYTFTVTPNSGATISLSSLIFDARRSNSGPGTIEVRSSLDNYGAALSTLTPGTGSGSGNFNLGLPTSLTAAQFQNLTSSITFRIYGYGATGTAGTLSLDNVILNGTTQPVDVPFGFTPIWGLAANGIVFGLRKLRNKQTKSSSDSLTAKA